MYYLHGTHATIAHDLSEKPGTLVDPNLRRITAESVFVFHEPTGDIVGTTNAVIASQAGHFETQEGVGAVLFPVRAGFNGQGSARTATCEALSEFISMEQT